MLLQSITDMIGGYNELVDQIFDSFSCWIEWRTDSTFLNSRHSLSFSCNFSSDPWNHLEFLVHLNEEGHRFVAYSIRKILEETQAQRLNHVGTWGDGDHCASWIELGEVG